MSPPVSHRVALCGEFSTEVGKTPTNAENASFGRISHKGRIGGLHRRVPTVEGR